MKYVVFILSTLLAMYIVLRIVTMNINYKTLTRYGYGFLAGNAILLVVFLLLMFFSGRKIFRAPSNQA